MQDLGDRLIIRFRPRRSWGGLLFVLPWLLMWTAFGAFAVYSFARADVVERLFLLLWLSGWTIGEFFGAVAIAWQLFGRELLIVTATELEVRRQVRRFARTQRYDASLVQDITAAPVPTGENEKPRTDFCLRMKYADRDVWIGEGMGEREAEEVASFVLARVRPRRWWGEDDRPASPVVVVPERMRRARLVRVALIAIPIALGLVFLVPSVHRHDAHPRAVPESAGSPPPPYPRPKDFANAREYAVAMTSWALRSGRSQVLEQPTCDARVTWTQWTCHARARAAWGPFAGRTLPYSCSAVVTGGVRCGPSTTD